MGKSMGIIITIPQPFITLKQRLIWKLNGKFCHLWLWIKRKKPTVNISYNPASEIESKTSFFFNFLYVFFCRTKNIFWQKDFIRQVFSPQLNKGDNVQSRLGVSTLTMSRVQQKAQFLFLKKKLNYFVLKLIIYCLDFEIVHQVKGAKSKV